MSRAQSAQGCTAHGCATKTIKKQAGHNTLLVFVGLVDKNATLQTKQKSCINRAPENRRTQSEIFGKEEPQA